MEHKENNSKSDYRQNANLEYARSLYSEAMGWYKNADAKAQLILSLDGAFITFFASAVFLKSDILSTLGLSTKIILGLNGKNGD